MARQRILNSLTNALAAHGGVRGLSPLLSCLRANDGDGDGCISLDEFRAALTAAKLRLSPQDLRALFVAFDARGEDRISVKEFLFKLAGDISPRRRSLVERIFDGVCGGGRFVGLHELSSSFFRAERHPEVERGAATPKKVLSEFQDALQHFFQGGNVTKEGLVDFYRLYAAFVSDNDFEDTVGAVWQPRQHKQTKPIRALADSLVGPREFQRLMDRLRGALSGRGVRGIVFLSRNFRAADRGRTNLVNEADFERCILQENDLTREECAVLIDALDVDDTGQVDYRAFLTALRGEMSRKRADLVHSAFDRLLDPENSKGGTADPLDVVNGFDSHGHPDVARGRRTADDVYREFLDTFDVGGVKDGRVTKAEFLEYYSNVSSCTPNDDDFSILMRKAWHLDAEEQYTIVQEPPSPPPQRQQQQRTSLGAARENKQPPQQPRVRWQPEDPKQQKLIHDLRRHVSTMGEHGYHALARALRVDRRGSNLLTRQQFTVAMEDLRFFSDDGQGDVDGATLLSKVQPVMSQARGGVVQRAFNSLDIEGNGLVPPEELAERFDSQYDDRKHPDSVFADFMENFDVVHESGQVTLSDFEAYYAALSANIPDDSAFFSIVEGCWRLPSSYSPPPPREKAPVVALGNVGAYIAPPPPKEEPARRNVALDGPGLKPDYFGESMYRRQREEPAGRRRSSPHKTDLANKKFNISDDVSSPQSAGDGAQAPGLALVCASLGATLLNRGMPGLVEWRRALLAVADEDGALCLADLKEAANRCRLGATDKALRELFDHLPGNGRVAAVHCLRALRPVPSPKRQALVSVAFDRLDVEACGVLKPAALAAAYDATRHPAVLANRTTAQDAYDDFIACFDVGTHPETGISQVTRAEFDEFHADVSATINDDDYFELYVRNVWGTEGSITDAVVTVVARRYDGRQTVEHLPVSLGIDWDDQESLLAALTTHCKVSATTAVALKPGEHADVAQAAEELVLKNMAERPRGRRVVGGVASRASGGASLPGKAELSRGTSSNRTPTTFETLGPGLARVAKKLREDLAHSSSIAGPGGLVHLERKLREAAGSNNRMISLEELAGVLKTMRLTSAEVRLLFEACDVGGEGAVDFTQWLLLLRPELTPRRLLKVQAAWSRAFGCDLDVALEPAVLVARYRAAAHPEVTARRASEAQVKADFLATFDLGSRVANMATFADFEAYFTNVSAGIESDEYFDLLLDSVWSDVAVEEQGSKPLPFRPGRKPLSALQANNKREPSRTTDVAGQVKHDTYTVAHALAAHAVTSAARTLNYSPHRCDSPPSSSLALLSTKSQRKVDIGVESLLLDLRTQLAQRGGRGLVAIARQFRFFDHSLISAAEFKNALRELPELQLTESERRMLFDYFDPEKTGVIDYEELLRAVRANMSKHRLELVRDVFDKALGGASVDPSLIASRYDASRHPDVLNGKLSAEAHYHDFLDTFDVEGDRDGKVTAQEFVEYYTNVSASIEDDDEFERTMRGVWGVPLNSRDDNVAMNKVSLKVLVTHFNGRTTIESVDVADRPQLSLPRDEVEITRRLRRQGRVGDGVLAVTAPRPQTAPRTFREVSATRSAGGAAVPELERTRKGRKMNGYEEIHGGMFGSQFKLGHDAKKQYAHAKGVFHSVLGPNMHEKRPATLASSLEHSDSRHLVDWTRERLLEDGSRGLFGLARKLRLTGSISLADFLGCLRETEELWELAPDQAADLFGLFAYDGKLDFESFIGELRGSLNPRRKRLLATAFDTLDASNTGFVGVDEIVESYDTTRHPDVLASLRTANGILRDFLDNFEVGGVREGFVSRAEFDDYYATVSASIQDDDYFELLIRNAWHIAGGEGWANNREHEQRHAPLRVLVTHIDGSQSVQLIKRKPGDKKLEDTRQIMRLLQKNNQGVDIKSITLADQAGDSPPLFASNTFRSTLQII